jgi:hypothetical protein
MGAKRDSGVVTLGRKALGLVCSVAWLGALAAHLAAETALAKAMAARVALRRAEQP